MNSNERGENTVVKVTAEAESRLDQFDRSPFSQPAFDILKTKISEYVTDIVGESIRISKRSNTDSVSEFHVKLAAEYLTTSSSRRIFRHIGTIGGIILGASLSNILGMTLTNSYTGGGVILSAILSISGAFMIAFHIAKD